MADQTNKLRLAVLGASGYTGAELVRLLQGHPQAEIVLLTAERSAGRPLAEVFPHLGGLDLPDLLHIDQVEWSGLDIDAVFCALPHGTTQEIVAGLLHQTGHGLVDELMVEKRSDLIAGLPGEVKVIDLSADFRLSDPTTYAALYGHEHYAPDLQPEAVYGLTEYNRAAIAETRLVACPGCYPTSVLVPLVPLLQAGVIEHGDIIVDAKSGVSGAGRAAKEGSLFAEVAEGIHPYGIASHRHGSEIEQELGRAAGNPITINFTPHLVPMSRGILATIYVKLADGAGVEDLRHIFDERFADEPFLRLVPEGVVPATRHVRGSNHALIGAYADRLPGRAIVVSVIDNLVKGASGQAVQNMNVAFGFEEHLGLEHQPLFP